MGQTVTFRCGHKVATERWKTGISVGDHPDRAAGGQTLGLALGGGGPCTVAPSLLPCGVCYCSLIPCGCLSHYRIFMDTLLLPNSAGGNCICVTLAGLWVVLSVAGKGYHLCRAADSEDASAVLKAGPSTPPLPGLWFQVFLKDLPTSIGPAPVMRRSGLGLDSWPKPRQTGWDGVGAGNSGWGSCLWKQPRCPWLQ